MRTRGRKKRDETRENRSRKQFFLARVFVRAMSDAVTVSQINGRRGMERGTRNRGYDFRFKCRKRVDTHSVSLS